MKKIYILFILVLFFISIKAKAEEKNYNTEKFKNYWYAGKAEVTSYKLKQARYGHIHDGYAILVFVTEDFSKRKQVKLDDPDEAGNDSVKVLKLNLIKKFDTGIYRYSIMESIFTPVKYDIFPNTLKLSMSSQEWCGNVFTQMNLDGSIYRIQSNSYFESEGDKKFNVDRTFLEDEIWTRIRLNPGDLPTGRIKIIPGLVITRLKHGKLGIENAKADISVSPGSKDIMVYTIEFPESSRKFSINFRKDFPHQILSWKEQYSRGFDNNAKTLVTTAEKNKTMMIDYWNRHDPDDKFLRKELGIE